MYFERLDENSLIAVVQNLGVLTSLQDLQGIISAHKAYREFEENIFLFRFSFFFFVGKFSLQFFIHEKYRGTE